MPVLPDPPGVQRREPPVLPPGEEIVGGRPRGRLEREEVPVPPYVVAVVARSERKVEVQQLPGAGREFPELQVKRPLREKVVPFGLPVEIPRAQMSLTKRRRPGRPGGPDRVPCGAETGVLPDRRGFRDEPAEIALCPGVFPEERIGEFLEHSALQGQPAAVIDEGGDPQTVRLRLDFRRGEKFPGRAALPEPRRPGHVEVELVPGEAAAGGVGAGVERLGGAGRKQRQRPHRVAPHPFDPVHEGAQVREVAGDEASSGMERVQRKEHPPPPAVPLRGGPCARRGGNDGRRAVHPAQVHPQRVVSRRKFPWDPGPFRNALPSGPGPGGRDGKEGQVAVGFPRLPGIQNDAESGARVFGVAGNPKLDRGRPVVPGDADRGTDAFPRGRFGPAHRLRRVPDRFQRLPQGAKHGEERLRGRRPPLVPDIEIGGLHPAEARQPPQSADLPAASGGHSGASIRERIPSSGSLTQSGRLFSSYPSS